ncbi:hypothetical protein QAD02_008134 [Eretmocerus hayati]|uniref:Uncharacterized protein n=1 Tax=Eretmocerus hayati TaxID=131215 RepID=A0ACC2N5W4_9HYME|nr:hypothetical protein QAD02_008134 [Eretmocerus hayati]
MEGPAEMYLTSQEVLDALKAMDAANDIIGIVTVVHYPRVVKDKYKREYSLFKFFIKCEGGHEIPVTAWDKDISRVKPFIKQDHIIHFDALFARSQDPKYRDDGKDYVFTIRSNTRLNVLGIKKHTIDDAEEEQVELYSNLQDCLNVTKTIAEIPESKKRIGLLTDLKFKINIAIFNFEDQRVFEQGQKIKVRGKMNNSAMNPTINVENSKDIEVIEGVEEESADKLRKINEFPKNDQFKDGVSKQPKVLKEG